MHWINPATNIDGTRMNDFAGINLYEDSTFVMAIARTPADTGRAGSAIYTPTAGTHTCYVTAFDNDTPSNESEPSNPAISLPFADNFPTPPEPSIGSWRNTNAEVNNLGVNPPSPAYVLSLDAHPNGGDVVELRPVDLSGPVGSQVLLSYWYQPQGTGNAPETGDELYLDFLNDQAQWINIRSYPGRSVAPFANEVIDIGLEDPGSGATFFYPTFQFRFRNVGSADPISHYDHWLIDDVSLDAVTGVEDGLNVPKFFAVSPNYPNPFNPTTTIVYQLPIASDVQLVVYDILGQKIKTIVNERLERGRFKVTWDGRNDAGLSVSSGIYMFRFEAADFTKIHKMTLLK
jgi:hypothetical protein